jgi:ribulose-5-phosphate 4-epimerase/fuculose-1-phosphate aldolase
MYISQRDVDKRYIDQAHFVAVDLGYYVRNQTVGYYGNVKPSVDAPVQARLYLNYPNIRCMVHAHVYVRDAPFTSQKLPCGAIEECEEIYNAVPTMDTPRFIVNLKGHGCLVAGADFTDIAGQFYARPTPEGD